MKPRRRKRQQAEGNVVVLDTMETSTTTIFSSDLLTPEEERELLAGFWECKSELVKVLIRHFPRLRQHRPPMEPWPMAQFIRDYCNDTAREVLVHSPPSRSLHSLQAPTGLREHSPGRSRRQAVSSSCPQLFRSASGSRVRPDAGHRSFRCQPRHSSGHLRHLVDSTDAADRRRPAEPPGQPVAASLAGTGTTAAGIGSPGPRRQTSSQPPGTGLAEPEAAWNT